MIVFLTFNDYASGVYASQVVDVVDFLNRSSGKRVRLISFISMRNFFSARRAIKKLHASAIVLPMFPGVRNWHMNGFLLKLVFTFLRPKTIICRGIFSSHLALKWRAKKTKVVFDARGAYFAEFSEYLLAGDPAFVKNIAVLEKSAIEKADKCLAVSQALVNYWYESYQLDVAVKTRVIPCTISVRDHIIKEEPFSIRKHLGFEESDIVLVYSGSSAGWQSFSFMFGFLVNLLQSNPRIKILFLTKTTGFKTTPLEPFVSRIAHLWLDPDETQSYLECCDYGILVREHSVTNQVASPTKFAEYLNAGCSVIISEGIGDFSAFVKQHGCGTLLKNEIPQLVCLAPEQRIRNKQLAKTYFTKEAYKDAYNYLLS